MNIIYCKRSNGSETVTKIIVLFVVFALNECFTTQCVNKIIIIRSNNSNNETTDAEMWKKYVFRSRGYIGAIRQKQIFDSRKMLNFARATILLFFFITLLFSVVKKMWKYFWFAYWKRYERETFLYVSVSIFDSLDNFGISHLNAAATYYFIVHTCYRVWTWNLPKKEK